MTIAWADALDALPTIRQGWTADLKVETADTRVWLERIGTEDGAPYARTVAVEHYDGDRWTLAGEYDGDLPETDDQYVLGLIQGNQENHQ